ncbi:hypothetical protein SF123566_3913 [Shigella flexneri 1235-66]|nr:hypothetical protein SF123566_3913 [Shigella flexneri 1235-66]
MFSYQWSEERRSLRCSPENKQGTKSKSVWKIKMSFQSEKSTC